MSSEHTLESYPKFCDKDDPALDAQMELVSDEEGELQYRLKDTAFRVTVDGDEFIPESIAPTDGYIVLRRKGSDDGMIRAGDNREVKLHIDMTGAIQATGGDHV